MRLERIEAGPPFPLQLTRDRIRVFVSSTIEECNAERLKAKEAVESLNHEAFLFEAVGARPWPPQDVYLPHLYGADIFVGIYRHSYGWVAPGNTISGLEDEFRHAMKRGMPCLVYIFSDAASRDDRLTALIQGIQTNAAITYSHYAAPSDLYNRIRDDIETVVASRFLRAAELEAAIRLPSGESVDGIRRNLQYIVPRPDNAQELLALLESTRAVQVHGPPGCGKTTFLESIAESQGFHFVSATGLSALDIINAITARLRAAEGVTPLYGANMSAALSAVCSAWDHSKWFTVVIDDVQHSSTILDLVHAVGGVTADKRLLYTVRAGITAPSHGRFAVTPFDRIEAAALFQKVGRQLSASELDLVMALSGGNPLLLRYCAEQASGDYEASLADFETTRWSTLPARSREVVSYAALADSYLSLEDILQLVEGGFVSPEAVAPDIESAKWFLVEDRLGYAIRHEHQRETVVGLLHGTPQRLAYYARRVAELMRKKGDPVAAFLVLDRAEDPRSVDFGRPALFEAARRGDHKRVAEIGQRLLEAARLDIDVVDTVQLLLQVSQARHYLGEAAGAAELLREAEQMSAPAGIQYLSSFVQEAKASYEASVSLSVRSLEELETLRDRYRVAGDVWAYARLSLELTVLLVRMDCPEAAITEGHVALSAFESLNDYYGADLARRNIASALSALPSRQTEFSDIMCEIQTAQGPRPNQRQRAWLCNVLVRRFRLAKQYDLAKQHAHEAIRIGRELGDLYLTGINTMNLGNVYRDEKKWDDALVQYESAGALAHRVQQVETEAKCSRLSSSIYLRKNQVDLAIQHALFGVALLRDTAAIGELRACLEQLAKARMAAHQDVEAAEAFLQAATVDSSEANQSERWDLAEQGLSVLVARRREKDYLGWLDRLIGPSDGVAEIGGWRQTEALFIRLRGILTHVDRDHCISIITLHCELMFDGLPSPVAHFLFERAVKSACPLKEVSRPMWQRLFPLLPILATLPTGALRLEDLTAFGEALTDCIPELHYKAHTDGSPHWVFTLGLRQPVICSLTALDNDSETALVCAMLMLFLKGFEAEIQERIIETGTISRREIQIYVANAEHLPDSVTAFVQPHLKDTFCTVTRPTYPGDLDVVPTVVCFRPGITRMDKRQHGEASELPVLFGETLLEVVFQLFKGEIEVEVLTPKIVRLVRQNVSLSPPDFYFGEQ